jgi:tetratricopeptide (TPR) repeat protein
MKIESEIFLPFFKGRPLIIRQRRINWREGSPKAWLYIIPFLFVSVISFSQAPIDDAIEIFNTRHQKANGLLADSSRINKCISVFENQIKSGKETEKCVLYYLLSLNFKVRFVYTSEKQKKELLDRTIQLAEAYIKKYPSSGPILFEYITSVGLKAELTGAFANATNGVVEKIRNNTLKLIQLDSLYYSATGWKVLGILNYKTPYIPVIIDWPNKLEAKRVLEKALKYFPADIANNFYYAEALLENKEIEKARVYFNLVLKLKHRENFVLEDLDFKERAKKYLKSL